MNHKSQIKRCFYQASGLALLVLWVGAGCHQHQVCKPRTRQASPQLERLWSSLQRESSKELLQAGVNYLLSRMFSGDQRLRAGKGTYRVESRGRGRRCGLSSSSFRQQLRDPHFLKHLHQLVHKHGLRLPRYLLPSKDAAALSGRAQIRAGCPMTNAGVELVYWKAISSPPFTLMVGAEACALGQKLLRWPRCFDSKTLSLLRNRLSRQCRL